MPLQRIKRVIAAALPGLHRRINENPAPTPFALAAQDRREQLARDRAQAEELLGHILPALDDIGVRLVEIDYDGENGQSRTVEIRARRSNNEMVNLERSRSLEITGHDDQDTFCYDTLAEAVQELAEALVEVEHPVFYKGLGAYGTVSLLVGREAAELTHYQRVARVTKHTALFQARKAGV